MLDFIGQLAVKVAPLIVLVKWFGFFFSATWLLILGKWRIVLGALGLGLVGSFVVPGLFALLLLPLLTFERNERKNPLQIYLGGGLACLLLSGASVLWCLFCLQKIAYLGAPNFEPTFPYLLLSYCTGVHTLMGLCKPTNVNSVELIGLFAGLSLAAVAYLGVIALLCMGVELSLLQVGLILFCAMLLSLPVWIYEAQRS